MRYLPEDFTASSRFEGARPGFVFKSDHRGAQLPEVDASRAQALAITGTPSLEEKRLVWATDGAKTRPSALYEPLCELAWRIVGHVLHAVIVLDETSDESLPVPKARNAELSVQRAISRLDSNPRISKDFRGFARISDILYPSIYPCVFILMRSLGTLHRLF